MQWTSEADQTLLLTMMKTHALKIDYAAIAAEWPDQDVKPTPRALKERIAKIQEMAKSRSAGNPVPEKRKRTAKTTTTKSEKRTPKRKRVSVKLSEEDDDSTGELGDTTANNAIKETDSDPEDSDAEYLV